VGEVVEVPGVTEEELRAAAIDRALENVDINPMLAPHEFTKGDYIERVKVKKGRVISESTALRKLTEKIDGGLVESGDRYDPRVKRSVVAYWNVGGDGDGALDG
jgi:hypothetical protein